jgi:hypothetical protein
MIGADVAASPRRRGKKKALLVSLHNQLAIHTITIEAPEFDASESVQSTEARYRAMNFWTRRPPPTSAV